MSIIHESYQQQSLPNGYQLVNGVEMHAEMGERFQIPNRWFRKNVGVGHFVELRIDSDRFSAHPDAPEACECEHCHETAEKPVLCHKEPASLRNVPKQPVPSRGWGEQFWVRISERGGEFLAGTVDNTLYESRLHGLEQGDTIYFHNDHILAVHGIHSEEIILGMSENDLREFGEWVLQQGEE